MLKVLRRRAKVVFWIVIIAFVAMIFIEWGMRYGEQYFRPRIATVDGKIISSTEYDIAYDNYLDNLKKIYGEDFVLEDTVELRDTIVESLIRRHILINNAKRLGIRASADEIQKEVMKSFEDVMTYNQYVQAAPPLWWKVKEHEAIQSILAGKAEGLIANQAKITKAELNNYYKREYESAHLKQILIDPRQFVPFEKVKKYYDENVEDEFMKPGKIRARHILIAVPEGATQEQDAAAAARIEDILRQLNEGADFATLAQQHSNCASRERGGDLGYFGEGDMVPEFEKAAYKLKKGDISPIVRTKFGYHIIKLEDRLEDEPRELKEVEDKIRNILVDAEMEKKAHREAKRILRQLKKGANFEQLAQNYSHAKSGKRGGDLGIVPKRFITSDIGTETIEFLMEEVGILGHEINPEFSKAAFELNESEISKVVKTPLGYHIIKMEKKIPPTEENFRKEYNRVLTNCLLEKRQKLADDWYAYLRAKSKVITPERE